MKVANSIAALVLIVLSGFSCAAQAQDVTLRPLLVVGDDGDEVLLSGVQYVALGEAASRIYVVDHPTTSVRVLDREGREVMTIGQRGRGPGEFSGISSLALSDGVLHVVDRMNARVSMFEASDGTLLDTYSLPEPGTSPTRIVPEQDGTTLLYHWSPSTNTMLHRYSEAFERKTEHGVPVEAIWSPDDAFETIIAGNPRGSVVDVGHGMVCISSYLYDGGFACYDQADFKLLYRAQREVPFAKPTYTPLTDKRYRQNEKSKRRAWRVNGPNGRGTARIHRSARGLHLLSTQEVAVFYIQSESESLDATSMLFIDVFNADGTHRSTSPIELIQFDAADPAVVNVLEVDMQNRVYISYLRDGVPVLMVAQMEW